MMIGARAGTFSGLRRLVAAAMARDLVALVVPGDDIARAHGLDLGAAGLRLAATPRHANVLLIVGPLPQGLSDAAVVAYAQMPRPRAILTLGTGPVADLPAPDATGALSQEGLSQGVKTLSGVFASRAFQDQIEDFDAPALAVRVEYTCPMHPEIIRDEPGSCPICGMNLVPRETTAGGGHDGHGTENAHNGHQPPPDKHKSHGGHDGHKAEATHDDAAQTPAPSDYTCPMHPEVISDAPGSCPKCGMNLVPREAAEDSGHKGHGHHSHKAEATHDDAAQTPAPTDYTCPMHPEVISDAPGSCPKCGMNLVPREAGKDSGHEGHGHHDGHKAEVPHDAAAQTRAPTEYTCPMHPEVISDAPGSCPKCGMNLVPREAAEDSGHNGGHKGHGAKEHDHSGHSAHSGDHQMDDGIEPGFMSMVDMTKDMPASVDGLKMEWIEVPFGPFLPGLAGGLVLTLTLDGDAVAKARVDTLVGQPDEILADGPMAVEDFVAKLSSLSPLSPLAYRVLARRALDAAAGRTDTTDTGDLAQHQEAALARERLTSHLSWLAGFAAQTGMSGARDTAARLHREVLRAADGAAPQTQVQVRALVLGLKKSVFLRARLKGIGTVTDPEGQSEDGYDRLTQRLSDIMQCIDIAGPAWIDAPQDDTGLTGHGMAKVNTPRGQASLHMMIENGQVTSTTLKTPSTGKAAAVGAMIEHYELGDALTAVATLDLDPWEMRA